MVYKAVEIFREHYPIRSGLNITLNKRIPVAAGLAGGSADAAATLKGLNRLFQTGLSLKELMQLAIKLEQMFPFAYDGMCPFGGYRGNTSPLPPIPDCKIFL